MATGANGGLAEGDGVHGGASGLTLGLWRHPARGWRAIARAPVGSGSLLWGVAAPLAAIGPVAGLIRTLTFGAGSMGIIEYRPTVGGAIATALVGWVAALIAVSLLALAIDLPAPLFGGARDGAKAVKAAVFGSTAWWVASGFAVLPALAFGQLLGLWSLVLLFLGAPLMMRGGKARATVQGLVTVAAGIALLVATSVVTSAVGRRFLQPTVRTAAGRQVVSGVPGISDARLTAPATDKRHAVAPGTAAAATDGSVAASSLQALLPAQVGGFARTALESQSNLSAGVASADAKATYVQGTDSFTLTISDAGQPGALATNNSVIAGEVNRVTDSGYQRSRVVDGIRVTEKWNNADHGGNYSRTVAGRFTVEAQGTAPSIDVLRGAVAAVDQPRLAALAR